MQAVYMHKFSLKTKVTLFFPLAITITLAVILFLIYSLQQNYIKETISSQQFQIVSILADEIDRKLLATQKPLLALAHKLTPEQISDPDEALGFLLERTEFTSLFDNGLFLFDRQGRIVAELPLGVSRVGKDFSFRDYLKVTLATKAPHISDPYVSSQSHHHPAIMLTAPILDDQGNVLAVLGGSIDLTQRNFLGDFNSRKFGKTGYMFLFSESRVIISHPDPTRIMKEDIPPGANLLLDRAINGFDGTDETINSRGLHTLTTFKHLKSKNWIIGANYPVVEAYEPIKKLKHKFIIILPLFSLAVFWFTRRYLNRFTDPIALFTEHVEGLAQKDGHERLFPTGSGDEVAVLAQAFNRLISQLDQQKDELLEQEVLYRTVVDFSSEMVFWITADRRTINYVSPSCQELTGYTPEEFYAAPLILDEMIHPDDRSQWAGHCKFAGGSDFSEPLKFRIVTKAGTVRWVNHLCRPVFDHQHHNVGIRGSFTDITLWKQAEASIIASEAKFRRFFDGSNDAIFIIGGDGLIKEANSEAGQRYGFSHAELVGMAVADFDAPDERIHVPERIARILADGKATFETFHRRKHDQPLAVEVSASLIDYEGGPAILAVARDITARNLADQLLHRQNEYLLALHETTLGLIRRLDVAGLLQAIVIRAGKLLGTEHCYVYLKNAAGTEMNMVFQAGIYNSLVHKPLLPGDGIAGRVWITGEPFHVDDYFNWEGRLPERDRDVLHAMAGVPLKVGGEVVGVLGLAFIDQATVFSDEQMTLLNQFGELASLALENARLNEKSQRELVERKKAEERLRKLSVAVEQSPVSIIISDMDGTIEYVNPHFTKLTGYSSEEAVGRNPSILKGGETSAGEYRQMWATILSGGEWRGEFHNRTKDGELYWEQALIAPIRDEQGAIKHFIAIKENITEQKRLESQLRHSQKMEAIGQLAGGISHDFNNILAAIIGFSTIIQLKLSDDSPLKSLAQQITVTAERGASLTQGLLAFSRKQVSNPVVMDLNEILVRVQQLLLRLICEDIQMEIILSPQKLPVMADSVEIEQILMNLATNARDALPNGGSIVITTEAVTLDSDFVLARGFGKPGEYAILTFTDSGQGMDSDIIKHIFEPFYTTKELGKGTGLGLSIVYGIIKKQNGYITCQSTIGIGTTFSIYLPLLAESPAAAELSTPLSELEQRRSDVILVADDNKNARLLSKRILEEFGYTVITACDGQEAVDLFNSNQERIDLLILDVVMPKLNGRQVCDAVHTICPDMKILFCSGYSEDEVISQGGLEKGTSFLVKPYTPKELLMKIREVLADEH